MRFLKNPTVMKKITLFAFPIALMAFLIYPQGKAEAHCDSIDGPVVAKAKQALESGNVNYILPYVYKAGETEVKEAFGLTMEARKNHPELKDEVDYKFFETAVRVHRQGEGVEFTGLKPAGIDYGPALPAAEEALETGSTEEVKRLILEKIQVEIDKQFTGIMEKNASLNDVDATRERVEAELMFEKYIDQLYKAVLTQPGHGEGGAHEHVAVHSEEAEAVESSKPAEAGIYLEGKLLHSDVNAINVNNQLMIPLRAIFEAAGAKVTWNEHDQSGLAQIGNKTLLVKIGDATILLNNEKIKLEQKVTAHHGRILIPQEVVEHVLGLKVEFDLEQQIVNLHH